MCWNGCCDAGPKFRPHRAWQRLNAARVRWSRLVLAPLKGRVHCKCPICSFCWHALCTHARRSALRISEYMSGPIDSFHSAADAVTRGNVSAVTETFSDANLVARLAMIGFLIFIMPCLISCACNLLSCTIFLPLYLWAARTYEPTLLGLQQPRSDADPLDASFEHEQSRIKHMLEARAEAGQRMTARIVAFLERREYVGVRVERDRL